MTDLTGAATRRLSFGEVALYLNENCQEASLEDQLIAALRDPSVDGFLNAMDLLDGNIKSRSAVIQETAREQSAAVGDADLRRLKRQFSSLKNTFLHYEVKDGFLAALADGLPNGTEQNQLEQLEAEAARTVEALRALKADNEQTQQAVMAAVGRLVAAREAVERHRQGVASSMAALRRDEERAAAQAADDAPEPVPEGPAEEECRAALAAADAETRVLEAETAAHLAEAEELAAALALEREELALLRAQAGELRLAGAAASERLEANTRFIQTSRWCDEVSALLSALSGVSLLAVGADAVHLRLRPAHPTSGAAAPGSDAGPAAAAVEAHELSLTLEPGTLTVADAELEPADADLAPALAAARAAGGRIDAVVREVLALLGGRAHRAALLAEARAGEAAGRYRILAVEEAGGGGAALAVRAALGQAGVQAEARLVQSWPDGADVVEVAIHKPAAAGGEGPAANAKVAAPQMLQLQGHGLAFALEAACREVAAT